MDATTPLTGGERVLAGRYSLRGLVGQGGMADVELALDTLLDREVAVKILHARYSDDPDFTARFRREAQASASLNHPNIVGVYDTGADAGRPFIVMEYVRGRSLRDVLRRERLPLDRGAEIVADAASGLHYAHERGLVHRDVKPGNVLVSDEGIVKVTDFGIARAVAAETVTQTAAVFGTAAYVAPEQAQGEAVDRRTDVYALGCVLYEVLAGRQPFAADSAVALAYKHVSETPVVPSRSNPQISPQLDAIVMRAMAKDPAERYQTARDLAEDIRRALHGQAVSAPPASAYSATQVVRRDPQPTMVAASPPPRVYERERTYVDEPLPPPRRSSRGVGYGVLVALLLAILVVAGILLANVLGGGGDEDLPEVQVPVGLVGLDLTAAQEQLRANGLVPNVAPAEPAPDAPPNTVIRTDPVEGTPVEQNTVVTLVPSSGPPLAAVPDVAGLPVAEAEAQITALRLALGERTEQADEEVEEGLVISTAPPAGDMVPEGTPVAVIVSTGPAPIQLPSVVGAPLDAAAEELEGFCGDAPCVGVDSVNAFSDEVAEGDVIEQDPAAGTEVERGATVTLVVSLGPEEPSPEPSPSPRPSPSPSPEPDPEPTSEPEPTLEPTSPVVPTPTS